MNREISNYYKTLVGKKRSEKQALEALYAAIRNEDISIIKAYKGKAPTDENEWERKKCEDMYPMASLFLPARMLHRFLVHQKR